MQDRLQSRAGGPIPIRTIAYRQVFLRRNPVSTPFKRRSGLIPMEFRVTARDASPHFDEGRNRHIVAFRFRHHHHGERLVRAADVNHIGSLWSCRAQVMRELNVDEVDARPPSEVQADQLRAARAMLNWTSLETSRKAGLSIAMLIAIERGTRPAAVEAHARLVNIYNEAGIHFERMAERGVGLYRR